MDYNTTQRWKNTATPTKLNQSKYKHHYMALAVRHIPLRHHVWRLTQPGSDVTLNCISALILLQAGAKKVNTRLPPSTYFN